MGATARYHWDERLKEDTFILVRGVDYTVGDYSICQQLRNSASARGLKISIEECANGIMVTVTDRRGASC
jgi:hypothetical protein